MLTSESENTSGCDRERSECEKARNVSWVCAGVGQHGDLGRACFSRAGADCFLDRHEFGFVVNAYQWSLCPRAAFFDQGDFALGRCDRVRRLGGGVDGRNRGRFNRLRWHCVSGTFNRGFGGRCRSVDRRFRDGFGRRRLNRNRRNVGCCVSSHRGFEVDRFRRQQTVGCRGCRADCESGSDGEERHVSSKSSILQGPYTLLPRNYAEELPVRRIAGGYTQPKGDPMVQQQPPRVTVIGFFAELGMATALVLGLFCGWKLWWQPVALGDAQTEAAGALAQSLDTLPATDPDMVDGVPVRQPPKESGAQFGILYLPTQGDYMRPIVSGVDHTDLEENIGHYPTSNAPGERGNVVLAGHRTGWGEAFRHVPDLDVGDRIVLETIDGWYEYEYRTGRYVTPGATSVLEDIPGTGAANPEPAKTGEEPLHDRILTLQTCNPPFTGGQEYFVAYSIQTGFTPRQDGPPSDIAAIQQANGIEP